LPARAAESQNAYKHDGVGSAEPYPTCGTTAVCQLPSALIIHQPLAGHPFDDLRATNRKVCLRVRQKLRERLDNDSVQFTFVVRSSR
jgi:hypothetical protein